MVMIRNAHYVAVYLGMINQFQECVFIFKRKQQPILIKFLYTS